ncbi:MAG: phosphatase PAP2 family protein [Limnohabitans sp.]
MTDRENLLMRMRELTLGWGFVGLIYQLSRSLQGTGTLIQETALDRYIPYDPNAIWWYIAFFAYIPWAYLSVELSRLPWLRQSMQVCAAICGLIYLLWPTTVPSPVLPPALSNETAGMTLLRWLQQMDTPQNCLPSLHAALTVLCGWALLGKQTAWRYAQSLLAVLIGLAICLSIIQLRRHLMADLVTGAGVGWLSGWLCQRWCEKKKA